LSAISAASVHYYKKHKKPVVLFVDNITELAKNDVATFQGLVKFAKREADIGNLVVNFVASEGHTPLKLSEMSEKSRLSRILEIGDLDFPQVVGFLTKYKYSETTIKKIFDIAGGRMTLLKEIRNRLQEGQNLERIEKDFIRRARDEFKHLPKDASKLNDEQKETWKQIIKIYDHPNREIPFEEFWDSIGSSDIADTLLQKNIFALHQNKDTVSFQSRPVELYVAHRIGEPGSEVRMKLSKLL